MADYIHPDVLDNGLAALTAATSTVFHICSSQPANYAGVAAVSLGTKSAPTVGSPTNAASGRKVTIAAIVSGSPGSVSANGTAAYWALVDGTRLLLAGHLNAAQVVTSGNPFTTADIDVTIPEPV